MDIFCTFPFPVFSNAKNLSFSLFEAIRLSKQIDNLVFG